MELIERVARCVDPKAFYLRDELAKPQSGGFQQLIADAQAMATERCAIATDRAKAAIRAMLDGVESNLSAVQYDPAPYTAMKHRIAAMRKEVE